MLKLSPSALVSSRTAVDFPCEIETTRPWDSSSCMVRISIVVVPPVGARRFRVPGTTIHPGPGKKGSRLRETGPRAEPFPTGVSIARGCPVAVSAGGNWTGRGRHGAAPGAGRGGAGAPGAGGARTPGETGLTAPVLFDTPRPS